MKRTFFKKLTLTVSVLLIFCAFAIGAQAASPSDFVDFPTGWSNEAVTAAVSNGLLNGRSANRIEPEGNLTRAEMATVINRAFGATIEKNISSFGDVSPNEWYYHEIAKAYNMQTFQGDDSGTMRPDSYITREEVFAVIARALVLETTDFSSLEKFGDKSSVSEWAKPYAAILAEKGYVNGDNLGNLNPLANITREEFAQIMHNIIKTYHITAGTHTYAGPASTLIRVGGVTLSNVTIEGDLILGDGVGKGDVTLVNVTIKGRLLARGGEGKVTLTNTTVAGGVVVKDVNGVVNFNNYRTEAPFKGIVEITKATFKKPGGGSFRPSTPESKVNYKVTFYEGPVADSSAKKAEKTVESGKTMAQSDIDDVLSLVNSAGQKIQYVDGEEAILHENTIRPELWYEAEAGKWERFDDTVVVTSNMNVYYTKKVISLFAKLKSVNEPISFSVPYQTDTRLMLSLKDAMSLARIQIKDALEIEDYYAKAIKKAAERQPKEKIEVDGVAILPQIIDDQGNIKFINVDVPISKIISSSEVEDEIEEYITNIIENNDTGKLESAINMVIADMKQYFEDEYGIPNVSTNDIMDYIRDHVDDRDDIAKKVCESLKDEPYYIEFINGFKKGHDYFTVNEGNYHFVMAVVTAVSEYDYDYLKPKIVASFGKVVDILGDSVKTFMQEAQTNYYAGIQGISLPTEYPSYLTFKVNPVKDVFESIYEKYYPKAIKKLEEKDFYHYNDPTNPLKGFIEDKKADKLIGDLLDYDPILEDKIITGNTGYSIKMKVNDKSGLLYYYDYLFKEIVLPVEEILNWYGSLPAPELEEVKASVYKNIAKALNKANEMLAAYEKDGSLPLGKNIDDLKKIDVFAKVFNRVEDKIVKALEKFKETDFYGKNWTDDSVKTDIPNAEIFADLVFGKDDPVYNIDSLMDDKYVGNSFNRAGFTDYTYTYDQLRKTVTVQAIENNIRGNQIRIRRYYQK